MGGRGLKTRHVLEHGVWLLWGRGGVPQQLSQVNLPHPSTNLGAPRCGSGPNWCLEGPPPSPIAIGGPFPQAKALPSPPSPSLFPPPPLALFAMLRDGAAQSGVGAGVLECRGGWRGGRLQRDLGPDPHLGALDKRNEKTELFFAGEFGNRTIAHKRAYYPFTHFHQR